MFKAFLRGRTTAVFALLAFACGAPLAAENNAVGDGASPSPLTLAQALSLAEQASPLLGAGRERENQARAEVRGSTAFYYPHLVAAAATGTGLAGSPGLAPDGVAGVMGSPFVAGPKVGADVSASWDVLDVNQMLNRAAAKDTRVSAAEQLRFDRVQVDQAALIQYFNAVRAQGQAVLWHAESVRVERMYRQVRYYESVGRYSEVQMLLLREMLLAARLEAARADEQARFTLQDLAVTLARPEAGLSVPAPEAGTEAVLDVIRDGAANPLLAYAQAQLDAARHLRQASLAQDLPRVFANASVGDVDKTLLVPDKDYSASVGVALPLFEGFQNASDLERARAFEREQERLVEDARLKIIHANDRYDDAVALDRLSLASLEARLKDARRNLTLAEDRYLRLTGPLSDLQQSLVNLTGIELELNAGRADLLTDRGAQKLFNGGVPAP